jgi:hypothetical protein
MVEPVPPYYRSRPLLTLSSKKFTLLRIKLQRIQIVDCESFCKASPIWIRIHHNSEITLGEHIKLSFVLVLGQNCALNVKVNQI